MPTKIEYLDVTWSPITGCTPISEGCCNCWAKAMTDRFGEDWGYDFTPQLHPQRLGSMVLKKGCRVGVCYMGDLFHNAIHLHQIFKVFEAMAEADQHQYFILTKRPQRMVSALNEWDIGDMKNWWFGVSVENQKTADERIPELLKIKGNLWVSVEPILSNVNIKAHLGKYFCVACGWKGNNPHIERPANSVEIISLYYCPACDTAIEGDGKTMEHPSINWVVIGAESGRNARKEGSTNYMIPLLLQCSDANVPVFLKQAWINGKLEKMPNLVGQVWDQMPR